MSAAHSFLTISLATVLFSVATVVVRIQLLTLFPDSKLRRLLRDVLFKKKNWFQSPNLLNVRVSLFFGRMTFSFGRLPNQILTTSLYTDQNFKTYIHLNGKRIENTSPSATNIVNRILWGLLSADMTALELDFQIFSQNKPESWKMDFYPKSNMTGSIVKHVSVTGKDTPEKIVVENFSSDITTLIIDEIKLSEISSTQQENELANSVKSFSPLGKLWLLLGHCRCFSR